MTQFFLPLEISMMLQGIIRRINTRSYRNVDFVHFQQSVKQRWFAACRFQKPVQLWVIQVLVFCGSPFMQMSWVILKAFHMSQNLVLYCDNQLLYSLCLLEGYLTNHSMHFSGHQTARNLSSPVFFLSTQVLIHVQFSTTYLFRNLASFTCSNQRSSPISNSM